ncbi:ABC transporter ATP-binding protein [Sinomicrobium soli]|uniref:ABC transporter ATP-binding protein n=1 Tax=Sinomicrobium sp. N-1-3-6 TaxID=2219864 RepID=UPI000DCE2B9A|nr:ABC transporter ATP-binding protein [Sinomicrobium sp. N-1-3-6]RAV30008.1 ABC transporter ATP-binding protein/permease [Sinomicrobium sp. N-1-3-6]
MEKKNILWKIIGPVRRKINMAMITSGLSSVFSIINLLLLAFLINALFNSDTRQVLYFLGGMLISTVISYVTRLNAFDRSHYAAFELEAVLRMQVARHLAILPLGYITEKGSGGLTKVLNDDVRSLHGFVADATPLYARAYVFPIVSLIILFYFDWRVALISVGIVLLGVLIFIFIMSRNKGVYKKFNDSKEAINVSVIEYVQAMPIVRVFDGGKTSFVRFDDALENYKKILTDYYKEYGLGMRISMFILNPLPTFIVLLLVGSFWYMNGQIGFLTLIISLLLGTALVESLHTFRSIMNLTFRAEISAKRIEEVLNVKPIKPSDKDLKPADASVVFENVSFTYEGREEKALEDISFTIAPKSFTAIIGSSGSGKSTILRLIPRFWDVQEGRIKIGGVDVKDMKLETLMAQLSFVFQDSFIFHDTVENNIKKGMEEADREQVTAASKAAGIHDEIMQLPDGYDTLIQERGINFSGGQKQRLAIARAILSNKPILVLDEATSFSDTENEYKLMQAFKNLMQDKTVIMIAHRLETIKKADQILVLQKGKVIQRGNHSELITQKGSYRQVWASYQEARNWHIKNV